ncbi:MAG: hypothetical protein HFH13_04480 [Dorea sp.]|nr:hypothetical protein [Dorea sp.]
MFYQKICKIRDALLTVTDNVGHYEALNVKEQYIVWAEDTEGESVHADNGKKAQVIQGTIDYFTRKDGDGKVDEIQKALDAAEGVAYQLNSVQYEEETGFIHYEWLWEVS